MNTSNTVVSPLTRGEAFTLSALADFFMACYQGRDPSFGNRLSFVVQQLGHKVALHHNRGMCIYQTRLTTPFQPHKAKTLSR